MNTTQDRITQLLEETDFEYVAFEEVVDPYAYVMGLDPGGTTGVAMLRLNMDDENPKPELVYLHQIENGLEGFIDWFKGAVPGANTQFVSEKWKERNIKGADRTPQYIEGAMHWAWGDHTVWQYPDQKELIPDQWLKDNNLWTEGKRHQMDALKHAFAYLRNSGNSATVESLSGEGSGEPMAQPGEAENAQLDAETGSAQEANDGAVAEAMRGLGFDNSGHEGREHPEVKIEGERKRRTINGSFVGYYPDDFEEGEVLFED